LPELPEVEAVRRTLRPAMVDARFESVVVRRPNLRFPFPAQFAARLEGRTVRALDRRGKYLVGELSSGEVLVMHLGMSGWFRVDVNTKRPASADGLHQPQVMSHDHVVFYMSSGAMVTFNDPRRFGFMDLVSSDDLPRHPALSALGPEPLSLEFDGAVLARGCKGKKTSLKAALSDQRVVAGLGNIYVCEALHRARLSPRRRASTIATRTGAPRDTAHRLAVAIKKVLNGAIEQSIHEHDAIDGGTETAYFPGRFRVYDREGTRCRNPGCQGVVKRIVQAGRATFYCPVCQR
jgi:formamidopyrimidine-DNA glycosylase